MANGLSHPRTSSPKQIVLQLIQRHYRLYQACNSITGADGAGAIVERQQVGQELRGRGRPYFPAQIARPTEVRYVQQCVWWALKSGFGLNIIGGGHSGHCLWSHVVSVDMGAFDQVHIVPVTNGGSDPGCKALIVPEAGCKTGDIVHKSMTAGVTVRLGARPSVGAALWLQGDIGYQARLHGLACDAILGAVMVSVKSGKIHCIGHVPTQYNPASAFCPKSEADLLWACKEAGTNFGILIKLSRLMRLRHTRFVIGLSP